MLAAGTTALEPAPPRSRKYTLTHNDITGNLRLTIGPDFNHQQISGFYTRLLRDEVVAEWVSVGSSEYALHVYCHVSGEERWLAPPLLRNYIFRREMPLVLDTLVYAERKLLRAQPELAQAQVYVHFQSSVRELDTVEYWGVLGDRSTWPRGPTSIMLRMIYAVVGWPPSLAAQPADLSIDLPAEPQDVETAVRAQQRQQQERQRRQELQQLQEQLGVREGEPVEVEGPRVLPPAEQEGQQALAALQGSDRGEDLQLRRDELEAQQLEQRRRWEQQRRRQELGGRAATSQAQAPAPAQPQTAERGLGAASAQVLVAVGANGTSAALPSQERQGEGQGSHGDAQRWREAGGGEAVVVTVSASSRPALQSMAAGSRSRWNGTGADTGAGSVGRLAVTSGSNGNGTCTGSGAGGKGGDDSRPASACNGHAPGSCSDGDAAVARGACISDASRGGGSAADHPAEPSSTAGARRPDPGRAPDTQPAEALQAVVTVDPTVSPVSGGGPGGPCSSPIPLAVPVSAAVRSPLELGGGDACTGEPGCACPCSRAKGEVAGEAAAPGGDCGDGRQERLVSGALSSSGLPAGVRIDRGPQLVGVRASGRSL